MCRDSFFLLRTEPQISYAELQDLTETLLKYETVTSKHSLDFGNCEYDKMGMSRQQFQRLNVQFSKFIILLPSWGKKIET